MCFGTVLILETACEMLYLILLLLVLSFRGRTENQRCGLPQYYAECGPFGTVRHGSGMHIFKLLLFIYLG